MKHLVQPPEQPDWDPQWKDAALFNVGQLLSRAAVRWPDQPAVAVPAGQGWKHITYQQLETDSNRVARGLTNHGIQPGQRVAMLIPPGIDFVSTVFALFKARAVVILVDPGIGKKNLLQCLSDAEPESVIGVAKAQIARWLYRRRFPKACQNFVVGLRWWPGCQSVDRFKQGTAETLAVDRKFSYQPHPATENAAVIFTSGSTGAPKGVAYSHQNFINQAIEIRNYFQIQPGGADVSGFPLFALFNSAMGKTTVFPRMDFTRPADVAPRQFLKAAHDWTADQAFGSPALWNTVSRWCEKYQQGMPSIQRAMSAGAPVPAHVLQRVKKMIAPDGEVFTPYGATEALPVACNSASMVLNETDAATRLGQGVCVGGRFPQIQWKVIPISDQPILSLQGVHELSVGEIGELIVRGPVVTTQYVTSEAANQLAKIPDGKGFWHRMGDVGYLDEKQRFWFCGRKSQRVITQQGTLYTVPCESILNTHPAVYRSALVAVDRSGVGTPEMVVEPWQEHWPATESRRQRLIEELTKLAAQHDITRPVQRFHVMRKLPVDIRHNSKIFREQIARMLST